VAPLVERLAAQDVTLAEQGRCIERQAGEVAALREERGRHVAELDRAASAVVALNDQLAAADRSRQHDVRRLSVALTVLAALTIAATSALAWVR